MISFLRKLLVMDRRIIYTGLALCMIIPMIVPLGLPVLVGDITRAFYNQIENLEEGALVVIGFEAGPSQQAEFGPMAQCLVRHLAQKKARIVVQSYWAQGCTLFLQWTAAVREEMQLKYGENFVSLGFRAGVTAVMDSARYDYIEAYSDRDDTGLPLSTMPIMEGFNKVSDIDLVIVFTQGSPGIDTYISNWVSLGDVTNIMTCNIAGGVPTATNLYQAGLTQGIIGGMNGAAQYEFLLGKPGGATSGMDGQGLVHLFIIFLVVCGNIAYFTVRRADQQARASINR